MFHVEFVVYAEDKSNKIDCFCLGRIAMSEQSSSWVRAFVSSKKVYLQDGVR